MKKILLALLIILTGCTPAVLTDDGSVDQTKIKEINNDNYYLYLEVQTGPNLKKFRVIDWNLITTTI